MKRRRVIVDIDAIINLFKDYCGSEDIPPDTMPVKLMIRPTEMGKIGILAESAQWPIGLPPLDVKFQLKRIYSA